ncbi:TVP38/TMEM64 family protein [Verrucomicrobiaceae bacterium 5K15]|uniref:TVP38/TMEM64 family membrane protein n=2 Tax=Oceaniferula flava TaxID=2800421 RepID=A0AAE2SAL2_9BACT|nr:TVP38/TMEM64 family protein [Oceaniferula flavus]MBM1134732.1 TVP38/TMEM64 family protein [Oceaniferula flavus]
MDSKPPGLAPFAMLPHPHIIAATGISSWLQRVLDYISGLDPLLAPLVFISFYILATVLFIPGSLITLAAGFLFGVGWGTLYVSLASVAGASAAFLIGRYVARDWVMKKIEHRPKFRAIDEAVGEEGSKIVFLLRLSPVFPFTLLNYALGLTQISFGRYVLASWIGMLPGTLLYVYLGSLFKSLAELAGGEREKTNTEWVFYGLGLLATLIVTIYITKIARKAINNRV